MELVHFHNIQPHLLTRISSLQLVYCANFVASSSSSPINVEVWHRVASIVASMPNLRSLHILCAYLCWRDYFLQKKLGFTDENEPYYGAMHEARMVRTEIDADTIRPFLDWIKGVKLESGGRVVVEWNGASGEGLKIVDESFVFADRGRYRWVLEL